jgi:hypothetical protein
MGLALRMVVWSKQEVKETAGFALMVTGMIWESTQPSAEVPTTFNWALPAECQIMSMGL